MDQVVGNSERNNGAYPDLPEISEPLINDKNSKQRNLEYPDLPPVNNSTANQQNVMPDAEPTLSFKSVEVYDPESKKMVQKEYAVHTVAPLTDSLTRICFHYKASKQHI